jgi:membrane-associated HD superfamily phosphohydrolase
MINLYAKIKLRFIFWSILVFALGFILRVNLAVVLLLVGLGVYIKAKGLSSRSFNLPNIILLFLIIFCGSYFIIKQGWQIYYIPFALVPMLSILLFNNLEISLLVTLAAAASVASISKAPFQLVLIFLISGIFAIILVKGARKRITIIRAGFIVGILHRHLR